MGGGGRGPAVIGRDYRGQDQRGYVKPPEKVEYTWKKIIRIQHTYAK